MEKKDLIDLISNIFLTIGFKRKGNNWVLNGKEINKIVNLQKSNYSNSFYINYGYIINGLDLTTRTHVENRLASIDKEEQKKITDWLDIETDIPDDIRLNELRSIINEKIVSQFNSVHTTEDLLNLLKEKPHLNNVPIVVKQFYNLSDD